MIVGYRPTRVAVEDFRWRAISGKTLESKIVRTSEVVHGEQAQRVVGQYRIKCAIVGLRDCPCLSGDCAGELANNVSHFRGEICYGSHAPVVVTVPLDSTNRRGSLHEIRQYGFGT